MRTRRAVVLSLLATLDAGCATAVPARGPAVSIPDVRGTLYIVGGGPQPAALVREFVDLAGGPGTARIVVFAMASSSGRTSGEEKAADFRALGAEARNVFVNNAEANTDSVARLLDGVTGIWFGGGDQVLLNEALRGSATLRAIRARYRDGAVVGGTSAGAAVMSRVMITGDQRRPGGARRDTTQGFMTIDRGNIITDEGFALLPGAVVDQHFLRRSRHNRLVSLVLEGPVHLGVGIDESTALVVQPDGRWRVAGASAAVVYDARDAAVTPAGSTLGASGIRMHVLPAGSSFEPATGRATLPASAP